LKTLKYKRIVLKLSGEALRGENEIYDFDTLDNICRAIVKCRNMGAEICIVVGAGNIWRGRAGGEMERNRADHMGMLATTINALCLQDCIERAGAEAVVMTEIPMPTFAKQYVRADAVKAMESGKILIIGCGTGAPFFSTDTAAVLKGAELAADAVLMAKNIDGVYSADPKLDPTAIRYDSLTFTDVLAKGLRATDLTAAAFGEENDQVLLVFGLSDPDNIWRVASGEVMGTIVTKGKI